MGGPPDVFGIAKLAPAKRRPELERQIAAAVGETTRLDAELDNREVVNVTWFASKFDAPVTRPYVVHGIADPLNSTGFESLLISEADDPDVKWLIVGIHMVASVDPITT